jgi:hypothetical protein
MAKQGFKILDSDMHVMERPDLWERYIDSKYKSQAPRGVTSDNVRDLRMVYPDGREWARRRSDKTGQSRVTTLNATKSSIEVTQSAGGHDLYPQQAEGIKIYSKVLTPEGYYRGSSSNIPWSPAKSMRE